MSSKTIYISVCGPIYGAAQYPELKDLETSTHTSLEDAVMYADKKMIAFWNEKVQNSKTREEMKEWMKALSITEHTGASFATTLLKGKYYTQLTVVDMY